MKNFLANDLKTAPALYIMITLAAAVMFLSIAIGSTLFSSYLDASAKFSDSAAAINRTMELEDMSLLNSPDGLSQMKNAYERLLTADTFDYYEIHTQPLDLFDYSVSDIFGYGYEAGIDPTQKVTLQNVEWEITSIKCCQLNRKAFDLYDFTFSAGSPFGDNDYTFSKNDALPVVLGYEYGDYYSVGDRFECNYLGTDITARVVGILTQDSYITKGDSMLFLDRYVLMPMFDSADTPEFGTDYYTSQSIHYHNKLSGCFHMDAAIPLWQVTAIINGLVGDVLATPIKVFEIPNPVAVGSITIEGSMHAYIILYACYAIAIAFLIVICFLLGAVKKRTAHVFGAYILSGAASVKIQLYFLASVLIADLLGALLAFIAAGSMLDGTRFTISSVVFLLALVFAQTVMICGGHNLQRLLNYLQTEALEND